MAQEITEVRWDGWNLVEDSISSSAIRLMVLCVAHPWSPAALATAVHFERLRTSGATSFAEIFIVNADEPSPRLWELGIVATPAIVFFWDGKPITVRRIDWDDDVKFVGDTSQENWLELIRHAREIGMKGNTLMNVDC